MTSSTLIDEMEGVAVIGMSCLFPGALGAGDFWRNLREGKEDITFFSAEELAAMGIPQEIVAHPDFVKAAPMIPRDVALFDADFFGFSPREAEVMDPQQRLMLENAWQAFEVAGYDPERIEGRVGVFAGCSLSDYAMHRLLYNPALRDSVSPTQLVLAADKDYLAALVSHRLDLRGPSVVVQAACATSLVAVHLACQSLLSYQCDMALAGGVSVRLPQKKGYFHAAGGIHSRDGHCRAFDAEASGTIFGSGVGSVVLKRLEDALADGDTVDAIIRGSAINSDGAQKVGFAAPGVQGQAEVIAAALALAEVEPETIGYVEAHGTGTELGDPVEVAALQEAFGKTPRPQGACALGAVKTNIGHLECAAGIAGLIKTVLALKHKQIPPSLNFRRPNPRIDFDNSPFYVNTELREWQSQGTPLRAGVSSFGIGGSNAHAILEQAPETEGSSSSREYQLLMLSARTETALEKVTGNLAEHLPTLADRQLADMAYTLKVGRKAFDHRRVVICNSLQEAALALAGEERSQGSTHRVFSTVSVAGDRPVAFLFPGQGSQYAGMGRGLYEAEPLFRKHLDRCSDLLRPHLELDLCSLLFSSSTDRALADERLTRTEIAQPAMFSVCYALAQLWISWGVRPQAMAGHSVGEYVAACLAGTFRLEQALGLVAARGRLIAGQPAGAMLSVPLSEDALATRLGEGISLAAVNGPGLSVVSGPIDAIDLLERQLLEEGVEGRRLHTSHAFHSSMMDPVLEGLEKAVAGCDLQAPAIPFLSNVTGTWITAGDATDPSYWVRHCRRPVRFSEGLSKLYREPNRVLLEVGPGRVLTTFSRRHPRWAPERVVLNSMRHPKDPGTDLEVLLTTLGRLWLSRVEIDWQGFYAGERRRRVALPTYPFERQRHWIDGRASPPRRANRRLGLEDWFSLPAFKQTLPSTAADVTAEESCWLLLCDDLGLAEAIVSRLRGLGRRVVTAMPGARFEKLAEDDTYLIGPGCQEDYARLLAELSGNLPDRVLHCFCFTGEVTGVALDERVLEDRGFYSLLFLVQAWSDAAADRPLSLAVVADHLWRVGHREEPIPAKATLLGPARSIPREYPEISCRVIDVAAPSSQRQLAGLAERVLAELSTDGVRDVALRADQRWEQTFEPVRLDAVEPHRGLRPSGVYWITGGLGGIGLELAELLARTVQARLILTGRTAIPSSAAGVDAPQERVLDEATRHQARQVRSLEELGAEVMVLAADVTDEEEMRSVVEQACERFGEIHGVIHAAGVAGGGAMQLKTREAAEAVMAPKVRGSQVLASVVANQPLDFLLLVSSTYSLTGGAGQVDYCAANAFLDAFAHRNAARGGPPTLAINSFLWSEVGMGVSSRPSAVAEQGARAGRPEVDAALVVHPLLGRQIRKTEEEILYLDEPDPVADWWLSEHRLLGTPVMPGVAYLEMARAAFEEYASGRAIEMREVVYLTPLSVRAGERQQLQLRLRPGADSFAFEVRARPASTTGAWDKHASGRLRVVNPPPGRRSENDLRALSVELPAVSAGDWAMPAGLYWGPRWLTIKRHMVADGLALLEVPEEMSDEVASFGLHPALFDVAGSIGVWRLGGGAAYLPLGYERLKFFHPLPGRLFVRFRRHAGSPDDETLALDFELLAADGRELVTVEGFKLKKLAAPATEQDQSGDRARSHGSPVAPSRLTDRSRHGLAPGQGAEAFHRALARAHVPQIVIAPFDARQLVRQSQGGVADRGELERTAAADERKPRPHQQNPYVAPRDELERQIADLWQGALGLKQVGVHDNFYELGGHSLMAVQMMSQLRSTLGIELPTVELFQHPTIAELAGHLNAAGPGQRSAAETMVAAPKTEEVEGRRLARRERRLARLGRRTSQQEPSAEKPSEVRE